MKGKFIMTCMWTESLETLIENKVDNIQIQCENKSEEKPDKYGRVYCSIHRKIVDEINKSRHKNCINKEKLIEYLIEHDTLDMELIIEYLERGVFDNE